MCARARECMEISVGKMVAIILKYIVLFFISTLFHKHWMKICLHITDIFADNFWMESDTLFWQYDVNSSSSSERNRFLWWLCSVVLNWMCCVWTDWKGETGKRDSIWIFILKKSERHFAHLHIYSYTEIICALTFCYSVLFTKSHICEMESNFTASACPVCLLVSSFYLTFSPIVFSLSLVLFRYCF